MENNNKVPMSAAGTPYRPRGPGGSRAGCPNKATAAAREAIARFVDGNIERLQEWLDMVAHGYKVAVTGKDGQEAFKLVPPNPERAFELFNTVVESHIPKLVRSEIPSDPVNEIEGHVKRYEFHSVTADQTGGTLPPAV